MFGLGNKSQPRHSRIDTLIAAGTRVEGNVTFRGGLRIDGTVAGDVAVESTGAGTLVVGEQGRVEGDVRVFHLVVDGTIKGSVYVTDFVQLRPSARVTGDVHYGTLELQVGAVIDGHLMNSKAGSADSE